MYDLNVKHKFTNDKEKKNIIKRLIEFGWDYVAWNTTANGKVNINEVNVLNHFLAYWIYYLCRIVLRQ
eukprot:gene19929-25891_t